MIFLVLLLGLVHATVPEAFHGIVDRTIQSIQDRYGGESIVPVFQRMRLPNTEPLFQLFSLKRRRKETLKIAFTGTSVTAGHDNYFNQSYPMKFDRLMRPVFQALGIDLQVSNVAMGNNPIAPYAYCVDTITGGDADIIGWEQGMMCPRHTLQCIELFAIHAMARPNPPILLVLDAVPNMEFADTVEMTVDRMLQYKGKRLLQVYERTGMHAFIATEAIALQRNNSLLSTNRLIDSDKPFGGKRWHPGPHGHQFVADTLAWNYLQLLKKIDFTAEHPQTRKSTFLQSRDKSDGKVVPIWGKGLLSASARVQCYSEFRPFPEENRLLGRAEGRWEVDLWETDRKAVRKVEEDGRGYLDRKFTLIGGKENGRMRFRFTSREEGKMLICEPPYSWSGFPEGYAGLNVSSVVVLDGHSIPLHPHKLGPCFSSPSIHPGNHVLEVYVVDEKNKVGISHFVFP